MKKFIIILTGLLFIGCAVQVPKETKVKAAPVPQDVMLTAVNVNYPYRVQDVKVGKAKVGSYINLYKGDTRTFDITDLVETGQPVRIGFNLPDFQCWLYREYTLTKGKNYTVEIREVGSYTYDLFLTEAEN